MDYDAMIAVLQAARDGKAIQFRHKCARGFEWCDGTTLCWDFDENDYRVKPEPREWKVQVSKDGSYVFMPRPEGWGYLAEYETVKVREVLP